MRKIFLSLFLFLSAMVTAQNINYFSGPVISGPPNQSFQIIGCSSGTVISANGTGCTPLVSNGGNTAQYNELITGCGVQWTTGLSFTVGSCTYSIAGITYNSQLTNLTLASDPSNPRIDLIYADNTGTVSFLSGTPAANPQQPTVDPATQIGITFIYIPAAGTSPSNTSSLMIFDEGAGTGGGEWNASYSANFSLSTNNPYHLTHDVESTNAVTPNGVTFASGTTINLMAYNNLVFYIRSKGQWQTGNKKYLLYIIFTDSTGNVLGNIVMLYDGQYGFQSSDTASYQQISIPITAFGNNLTSVSNLVFSTQGGSGSNTIGYYLDYVTLQGGANSVILPSSLMNFKGVWNSTTAYNANDTVVSSGIGYVALQANTNQAVSNTSYWAALASQPTIPVVVDTTSPVTVSSTLPLEYHYNENATSTSQVSYNLPPSVAGKKFCFTNANNGTQANTGVLTLTTSGNGQYIILGDGTLSPSGGEVASTGAAADSACLTGVDSTHWMISDTKGNWNSPTSGPFNYVTSATQPGSAGLVNVSFTATANLMYILACTNTESNNGPSSTINSPTPTNQGQVLDNAVGLRWFYFSSGGTVSTSCNAGAVGTNKVSIFSCSSCITQTPLTTGHTSASNVSTLTVSALTTSARSYTLACEGDTSGNLALTSSTINGITGTIFDSQIQNANCAWVQSTTSYSGASASLTWGSSVTQAGEIVLAFQY